MAGQRVNVYGDGGQTRDFIYSDDIVSAIVASARHDRAGEIFQIASGREVTINELVATLKEVMDRYGVPLEVRYEAVRQGEVLRNFSDTRKAQSILGWKPRVHLAHGLDLTVRWFLGR
jgi:UDP-glucose 4-epimerase